MNRKSAILLAALSAFFIFPISNSLAFPTLQLDIAGGWYDTATETVKASGDVFTLYAFLIPDSKHPLTDPYYISAAIIPPEGSVGGNFGSFIFDGKSISSASHSGTPPSTLPGGLPGHGIYPAAYEEFPFWFSGEQWVYQYDVESTRWPGPGDGNKIMYYRPFEVNIAGLAPGYGLHFDLYHIGQKNGELFVTNAPPSHDAETTRVPEPGTLLLLGFGIVGLVGGKKLKSRRNRGWISGKDLERK